MSVVINGSTGINLVQAGAIPPASVLQVVSTLSATQSYQDANGTDAQLGELTHTITPLGNNSKFLVTIRWFGEAVYGWDMCFNIHQDGVRVNSAGGRGAGLYVPAGPYFNNNDSTPEIANFSTLVNTSSIIGTPITYTAVVDAHGSLGVWNNRTFGAPASNFEVGTSEIIVMEIAA